MKEIIKKPSAWFPLVMSLAALILLLSYLAIYGIKKPPTSQTDEGAAARIFQFLLAGQLPIVTFFVVKWIPKNPRNTLLVLLLQIVAALIPFTIVYFLEL